MTLKFNLWHHGCKAAKLSRAYRKDKTEEKRKQMNEARRHLFTTYEKVESEDLQQKVREVESASDDMQYGEAW